MEVKYERNVNCDLCFQIVLLAIAQMYVNVICTTAICDMCFLLCSNINSCQMFWLKEILQFLFYGDVHVWVPVLTYEKLRLGH